MPASLHPPAICRAAGSSTLDRIRFASWSMRATPATRCRSSTKRRCCVWAAACRRTGLLNEDGMAQAMTVMHRYHAVARAMGADPFEVLATAAVRDARNGPDFVDALQDRMPDVPIRILSGWRKRRYSADGMLCGIPAADGMLADIGGGSLELVRLVDGTRGPSQTLRLGVIRLAERSGGDPMRARAIAEADLQTVPWLEPGGRRRSLSGRRRVAGAGADPHGADRLPAAHGASLHHRPGGGARPRRR